VLLGWSQKTLAKAAGMYPSCLRLFERNGRFPITKSGHDRLAEVRAVLEAAGVVFTNGDVPRRKTAEVGMTPEQCRQARRLLGWTQQQLAKSVGVDATSVGIFERIGYLPQPALRADRLANIRATLEAAGIEFTDGGAAPGVRLWTGEG
jgi:DNA-binding XRE family transcriptional regulator